MSATQWNACADVITLWDNALDPGVFVVDGGFASVAQGASIDGGPALVTQDLQLNGGVALLPW